MATPGLSTPNRARRKRPVNNSPGALSMSISHLEANNDLEERKLRRKSKLLTNNILSPGGVQASPSRAATARNEKDRRKSINLSHAGMTNLQLKEHYASCIKLSSENKINVKNAFGLHLIDYMKDLLKQSQKDDSGTNFQVASCTLDAGVKIYAYRVDSVHSEAYKVLGSLGRVVDNENEQEEGDPGSQEGLSQPVVKKTKKRAAGKTIETNVKNINCEQLDIDYEVDPFFTKVSSACDEAGTTSLLSFHLKSHSDLNDLLLDSATKIDVLPTATIGETTNDEDMVDLSSLRDMYNRVSMDKMEICPQFSNFNFTGWDKDSQDIGGNIQLPDDSFDGDNIHRFDENAPVLSDAMETFDTGGDGDYGDDDNDDDDRNDLFDDIRFDGQGPAVTETGQLRGPLINSTGSTHLALSLNPSEYSYFSEDLMKMWAGPLHWKIKAKSKDKTMSTTASSKFSNKKTQIRIDFDDEIDLKKHFTTGRGSTHLKGVPLDKAASQMSVLPPDLRYETELLFKLCTRKFITIKRQNDGKELKDEGEDWYNYDNKNDREGFCPVIDDYGDDNYDDDDAGGCGVDITLDENGLSQQQDQQTLAFGGDGLVAPPNKIRVLDINYAKAAKRIDIKKLKGAMWKMLTANENNDKENIENNLPKPDIPDAEDKDGGKDVSGSFTFKTMYDALPNKVSANMSKNLSTPIAFVCLLYLANEKNLKLTGSEDMSDIKIESEPS